MANLIQRFGRLNAARVSVQSARCFANAAPAKNQQQQQQGKQQDDEPDVVMEAFKEQQQHYRALMEGSKHLQPPLNGDEAAIKKYATEIEALRKKIGMPEHHELLQARMAYDLKVAHYDVQSFVASSTEGKDFGKLQPVVDELVAMSAGVELSDAEAVKAFQGKVEALEKKHKLEPYEKIKEKSILEMYKSNLKQLRLDIQEEMDTVRRRDHLENVEVDAASLKASPP